MNDDAKCNRCHAPVIWVHTLQTKAKRFPVEKEPIDDGDRFALHEQPDGTTLAVPMTHGVGHVAHACPQAELPPAEQLELAP